MQGLNIRIPDEYTTTLIIESLSSSHNGTQFIQNSTFFNGNGNWLNIYEPVSILGKYTCIAENSAGREYFSSELTVQSKFFTTIKIAFFL